MDPATLLVRELVEAASDDLSWGTKAEKEKLKSLLSEGFVVLSLENYDKYFTKEQAEEIKLRLKKSYGKNWEHEGSKFLGFIRWLNENTKLC